MINVTLTKLDGTKMNKQVEKPKYGGTLNLLGSPSTFGIANMGISSAGSLFVSTFLHGDWARGTAGTGELSWQIYEYMSMDHFMPALAEKWEMPDDETIIYHIRRGVHWALDSREASRLVGGRELTADDVAWNLNYQFFTVPATALKRSYGKAVEKADVRATDKYTVVVKAPKLDLFQFLGFMSDTLPILPPEVVQKYGPLAEWDKLVTTGAFIIKDYVSSSVTTFVKNPNYWEYDPILGKDYVLPYVDSIKYLSISDQATAAAALRTGKVDALGTGGVALTKDQYQEVIRTTPRLKTKTLNFGTQGMRIAMQMNDKKAPWQDLRVRRALMMAIDHQGIVDTYYGGAADPQSFPLPGAPELYALGWNISLKELSPETQALFKYSPDEAKKLLAEAGYPNGFKTSLMISSTSAEFLDLGTILKESWAKVGIDLTLDIREASVFSGISSDASQPAMIHANTWGTATLYNKFAPPPNSFNQGNFDDPRINEMRSKMFDVLWDIKKRTPIMRELYAYTVSQVWYLSLPSSWGYTVYQPWVKNFDGERSIGYWGQPWRFMWLDLDLKKKLGY